jgi:hypothetical protein
MYEDEGHQVQKILSFFFFDLLVLGMSYFDNDIFLLSELVRSKWFASKNLLQKQRSRVGGFLMILFFSVKGFRFCDTH